MSEPRCERGQEGVALILAISLLLMVSAIAVSTIAHSGAELRGTADARSRVSTFYAAEGGLALARARLVNDSGNIDAFQVTLDGNQSVRSGPRQGSQPLTDLGEGPPPDLSCIELRPQCFRSQGYRSIVTATGPSNASIELESHLRVVRAGSGSSY